MGTYQLASEGAAAVTRFLVVLTDIRPVEPEGVGRDERSRPERRRQVVGATDRDAADRIATAFAAFGMVRAGRQRVKVISVAPLASAPVAAFGQPVSPGS